MTITRKRIINPQRYLYALHHGDKFYIAVPRWSRKITLVFSLMAFFLTRWLGSQFQRELQPE